MDLSLIETVNHFSLKTTTKTQTTKPSTNFLDSRSPLGAEGVNYFTQPPVKKYYLAKQRGFFATLLKMTRIPISLLPVIPQSQSKKAPLCKVEIFLRPGLLPQTPTSRNACHRYRFFKFRNLNKNRFSRG